MAQRITSGCPNCGIVYAEPRRTVVYSEKTGIRSRNYRLGFRCPKCDTLILATTSQETAALAVGAGSIAFFGKGHPREVLERIAKARVSTRPPFSWDEYLDGYLSRIERRDHPEVIRP